MPLEMILLAIAKLAVGVGVAFLWIWFVLKRIIPGLQENKKFPYKMLIVLFVTTVFSGWLSQLEFAYREPESVPQGSSSFPVTKHSKVSDDRQESLSDRTKRMKSESELHNEAEKEKFLKNKDPK